MSVSASDLWVKSRGWFDPGISRSLLGASYQRASDGKCVEAEALLSASEKVPALGSLVGRMLLAYTPPTVQCEYGVFQLALAP